jgi:XTP/dITP diphosphohydrolase
MKPTEKTILIATGNRGKLVELEDMLTEFPVRLLSLLDFPDVPEVIESGATFGENARLKAVGYATYTSIVAVADDSGLEVDVLNGHPGVLSARYGGEGAGFDAKMGMLLQEVAASGTNDRRARFVCHIAVADAAGQILHESEGVCEGTIAPEPRGSRGFGYDPIFIPKGYELTYAELPATVKREISHRSRAFRSIIPFLQDFIAD